MALPLYPRGLAKSGPFLILEAHLREGEDGFYATGRNAALVLRKLGRQARPLPFPMPYLCSWAAGINDKQCEFNRAMWRHPSEKAPDGGTNFYVGKLSDDLAQHLIDFFVQDTEQMRQGLIATLQSHGDTILKRWKKMSKDKRGSLLAKVSGQVFGAWPPTVCKCSNLECEETQVPCWAGGAWLNSRDLAEDWMRLVSILHVRSVHDAASWAMFDTRNGVRPWSDNYLPAWFNSRCVLMCGDQYGKLCEYDNGMTHAWAAIGFPRAFTTIQTQHELMYTLQNILEAVINGSESTGAAMWKALVADSLHPAGQDVSWNTYTCQAFTHQEPYSPEQLARKADARLNMIKDELLLMQTDPAYMGELIKSKRVAISNISSDLHRENQMQHAGTLFLMEYFNRYIIWQTISSRCHELVAAYRHSGRCEAGMHMTPEVSEQMQALSTLLNDSFRMGSANFENIIHSTRAFQRHFKAHHFDGHLYVDEKKQELNQQIPADRLRWRIKDLRESAAAQANSQSGGYSIMFDNTLREEKIAQIMDKPTREYLSDMMIIDEIRTLLSWSQRANCSWDEVSVPGTRWKQALDDCCVHHNPDCSPPKLVFDNRWQQRVGMLIQHFMDMPWPTGRKDLKWLDKANKVRDRLACLWKGVTAEYEKAEEAGGQSSACGKHLIASLCAFDTDAAYQAALRDERSLCEENSQKYQTTAEKAASKLLGYTSQSEWGSTPTYTLSHKPSKPKSKPAEPDLGRAFQSLAVETKADLAAEEVIAVKKESLAVFLKMYRADADCLAGGTIQWEVFVRAMKDAGFFAEEASGSAVSFEKSGAGSISFHRPHPDAVLDHIMLYAMAKRMAKWFGFHAERFVLRAK